jgi:hypothetical protein
LAAGAAASLGILYDRSNWRVAKLIDGVNYAAEVRLTPANGRHLNFDSLYPQEQIYGMGSPLYYLYRSHPTPAHLQGQGAR